MSHPATTAMPDLTGLAAQLDGSLESGDLMRTLYATDASEYRQPPLAVAFPESEADVRKLVLFCARNELGFIPRTAGTSIAGQVVGSGLVVDLGRHLNQIVAVDPVKRHVRVQPGVVRNELNAFLQPYGIFFGPETSTANRAMIGGMVGNNSCGSNSIVYGSTRDHLVSARGFLSDGSPVRFGPLSEGEFHTKCAGPESSLEARIYRHCRDLLSSAANRETIRKSFPKPSIPRRNTGYALDLLMDARVFDPASDKPFNLCRLLAGSEGTLFVGVEFELDCSPLPPPHSALLCAHFSSVDEALRAVTLALPHHPYAIELIDRHLLEATKRHIEHAKNRFFVEGDPGAVLAIDIRHDTEDATATSLRELTASLKMAGLGYHYPVLQGSDQARVWELRRAGQALISNIPGDAKPREVVEDTAVDVHDLPAYIAEFDAIMREKYHIACVYYAHAGTGEIHTRPLFDLKTPEGKQMFRSVAEDIAALVKKYHGSLSGEHGDGRLRGEFIPFMVGDECYEFMRRTKAVFDPRGILNPGKIIDTPPMDAFLRHSPDHRTPEYATIFDFSSAPGIVRAVEQCNGSGECRKGPYAGGAMCPSYMATRSEEHSTRGRANVLREALLHPRDALKPFDSEEVREVMALCLSCKACKSECPANVDMAKLKAEFLQHYHDAHGAPIRSRLVARFASISRLAAFVPQVWNTVFSNSALRHAANRLAGFHPARSIPLLGETTLSRWNRQRTKQQGNRRVYFFCDEFTEYSDTSIGQKAILLLEALGYEVVIPSHAESGRSRLSKGFLREARKIAQNNICRLAPLISDETPLVGIEPSAILSFRDEYIDLVNNQERPQARALAKHTYLIEEFLVREADAGRIGPEAFRGEKREIRLHGHCFQKALSSLDPAVRALQLPQGYVVKLIPSGCCGMAGSFGYEAEHYDISMQIGEMVLFPAVRSLPPEVLVAAPGTSCRHQIHDGTGRRALHPVEILYEALRPASGVTPRK